MYLFILNAFYMIFIDIVIIAYQKIVIINYKHSFKYKYK
jgi:hypothetical protein